MKEMEEIRKSRSTDIASGEIPLHCQCVRVYINANWTNFAENNSNHLSIAADDDEGKTGCSECLNF